MEFDYALLADHAEVINGKLYLMGGGWDVRHAPQAPARAQFAVALGIRVAWEETNLPIALRLALEDDDGAELLRVDGQMQVGRPPQLPPGSSQLSATVVVMQVELPRFGGYRVRATATGPGGSVIDKALPFRMVQAGPLAGAGGPQPPGPG